MPSFRLARQDRQQIAVGLAEGCGYAEIGRRLDRPTSTISREVQRNGGPTGYRAERAHQATAARARRRPPPGAPTPTTPAAATRYGRDPQAVRAFQEQLTALTVHTGLAPMAARVLAYLYTTDSASLTSAELVEQLRVSPASISKATGDLERQQLIRRERDPHRRRDRYLIDDDVWHQAWLASARMNTLLADSARRGAEILGPVTPAGARLTDTALFLDHVGQDMIQAAERWRTLFRPRSGSAT